MNKFKRLTSVSAGRLVGLLRLNLTIQTLVGLSGRNLPIPQRARNISGNY